MVKPFRLRKRAQTAAPTSAPAGTLPAMGSVDKFGDHVADSLTADATRSAVVRKRNEHCCLYMKCPESTHQPSGSWEKIALPGQLADALSYIETQLKGWPASEVKRAKQEAVKLLSVKKRERSQHQTLKGGARSGMNPINRKTERREAKREAKAETAAKIDQSVEQELLARLRTGMYGKLHKAPESKRLVVSTTECRALGLITNDKQLEKEVVRRKKKRKRATAAELDVRAEIELERELA